jgi:hypothetical protein
MSQMQERSQWFLFSMPRLDDWCSDLQDLNVVDADADEANMQK